MTNAAVANDSEQKSPLVELLERFEIDKVWHENPKTRMRHRMSFRNERKFYRRTSSKSGSSLISIYHADSPYQIYSAEEWWSDDWDGSTYGRAYDFNRPFFDQFKELQRSVPRIALFNVNPYNSTYCQQAYNNKNCYVCSVVKDCEDCLYITHSNNVRDSIDCDYLQYSELCYDCLDSDTLYGCIGCDQCHSSAELVFCTDCIGCSQCIGCWGLRNQKWHIFNVPYPEEEYRKIRDAMQLENRNRYLHWAKTYRQEVNAAHTRTSYLINTESCTGNNIVNAKDSINCFDSFEIEHCENCTWAFQSHHCAEIYGMGTSEWVYEGVGVEKLNFCGWNTFVSDSSQTFYSDLCFYSTDLFGCVGLRRKKNCILNKEYSSEAYQSLTEKIRAHMKHTGEWGRFFPASCSPFAYNETVAQERFPITQAHAEKHKVRWRNEDPREYRPAKSTVPEISTEAGTETTQSVYACEKTKKNYQIQHNELVAYQRMKVPIPHYCAEARYDERVQRRKK